MAKSTLAQRILETSKAPSLPANIRPAKAAKPSLQNRIAIWTEELAAGREQFETVRALVRESAREVMAEDAALAINQYRASRGLPPL